jgi:hypothetical protein
MEIGAPHSARCSEPEPTTLNPEGKPNMKRLILALSLATVALAGCAQLKEWYNDANAHAGATAVEEQSPFPKSSSNIAGN